MKKKIRSIIIGISILLVILIISILFCLIKYPNIFEKTIKRDVIVSDNGISEGVKNVYDSVVVVQCFNNSSKDASNTGTGFIYSKDGYIITNQHVVDKSKEIKVILTNGNTLDAELIGSDEYDDIAVLKIDSKFVSSVANIGSSENINIGDTVFAVGTPMNEKYAGTVTRGILSGKNRLVEVSINSSTNDWIMNVLQTDASLNPGNSGGPLCDVSGNVIGVNTMKISEDEIEGIGFAINIEDAVALANKFINNEEIVRPYLGISMSDISVSSYYLEKYSISLDKSITSGVVVLDVNSNSSSEKAGIKAGDVITSIGDYEVNNVAELKYYSSKYKIGDKVEVSLIRGTKTINVKIVLSENK